MSALAAPGSMKEQIKSLLKANCKPGDVAMQVGCDPSYVSQLLQDTEFAQEVFTARIDFLSKNTARDLNYDEIEDQLIDGLKLKISQGAAFFKTETLLRAISTINQAKRRSIVVNTNPGDTTINNTIIQLTIPQHAIRQFQVNAQNEVIAVGQQELISMPAKALLDIVKEKHGVELRSEKQSTQVPDKEVYNPYANAKDNFKGRRGSAERHLSIAEKAALTLDSF